MLHEQQFLRNIMQRLLIFCAISLALLSSLNHCKIVQISMMKAGTHLLVPLIEKMTDKKLVFIGPDACTAFQKGQQDVINVSPRDFHMLSNLPNDKFWVTHSPYVEKYAQTLSLLKYQVFFIYRDPRDVIVSLALYIRDKDKEFWPGAQQISLDDTITRLIVGGESMHVTSHHISKKGVLKMYEAYLPWMNLPFILNIRYEDLVGPQGGGDWDTQINTILIIAEHIGKNISYYEASLYGASIFGGTHSFNKGQIGSWKDYFTKEHIALFKEHAGQLLIDLGYEHDFNW